MLPVVQATKAKEISEAASKLLEVLPVELKSGLKALATSQREIFLCGNNKSSSVKGIGRSKITASFPAGDA